MQDDELYDHHGAMLTRRQRQVLRLQAYGLTHQEIAEMLGVTQPTVSRHYAKYGHPHNIRPRGKRFREARTGPYKMGKLTFPSRSEAARCLGLCREKLRRWERDPVKHGQDINIAMARYVKRTGK